MTTLAPSAPDARSAPNPLREGLRLERIATVHDDHMRATGDLASGARPALYNALLGGSAQFTVVGFARRDLSDEAFLDRLLEGINKHSSRLVQQKPRSRSRSRAASSTTAGAFDDPVPSRAREAPRPHRS